MTEELYGLFERNFPFIVRDKATATEILSHENNKIIEERDERGELIGASVINNGTILMLCVDKPYRNRGIGSRLLSRSETAVRENGYSEITAGTGSSDTDYLMPGVPTSRRYFEAQGEELYDGLDASASDFFTKRGYIHDRDCDCFDMRFKLRDFDDKGHDIGDRIDGIVYRWAEPSDRKAVFDCTDNACTEFTRWYRDDSLYQPYGDERVLIAADNDTVAGALIVSTDSENAPDVNIYNELTSIEISAQKEETPARGCVSRHSIGSIGCTAVRTGYRGRHIASNLALLGTKHLRDAGMTDGYLSYTYTGLDRLYGYAGYKICVYFMMAKKQLR